MNNIENGDGANILSIEEMRVKIAQITETLDQSQQNNLSPEEIEKLIDKQNRLRDELWVAQGNKLTPGTTGMDDFIRS